MSAEIFENNLLPEEEFLVVNHSQETAAPEVLGGVVSTNDQVKDYLRNIGKVPLLDAETEVELSRTIEAGLFAGHLLSINSKLDAGEKVSAVERNRLAKWLGMTTLDELQEAADASHDASQRFIESNLRLVVSIAKKYAGRNVPFMDLIQEGNLGLAHAVEMFDYAKGYKFSTYATWWIRQSISRAIDNGGRVIRIPIHAAESIRKLTKLESELTSSLGREPNALELSTELKMSESKVNLLLSYRKLQPISLDMSLSPGGVGRGQTESTIQDVIEDVGVGSVDEDILVQERNEALYAVLKTFPERDAGIIMHRFGLVDGKEYTLDETGKIYGVTKERVRQVQNQTMMRLRIYAQGSVDDPRFDVNMSSRRVEPAQPDEGIRPQRKNGVLRTDHWNQLQRLLAAGNLESADYNVEPEHFEALKFYLEGGNSTAAAKLLETNQPRGKKILQLAARAICDPVLA